MKINYFEGRPSQRKRWLSALFLDSLRWSKVNNSRVSQVIAAALGLAGPIAVGTMVGHVEIGIMASLGGLALSEGGSGETFRDQLTSVIYNLVAGCVAMLIGITFSRIETITVFFIPAVAFVTGLFGSISRTLARLTTLFLIYTIIAMNHPVHGVNS